MQDQLDVVKEVISIFLKDSKEGKKQLIEWFLNSVMEEEARVQLSSMPYERTEERKGHRNGSRTRKLKTVDGVLELKKPQIREFPFKTRVFERYSRVEKALDSVILESFLDRTIDGYMKFIYVDAAYYRARDDGIYANRVMHVDLHHHRTGTL